jgi:curved DNA-binding protein
MASDEVVDYYEILQISTNAQPETIHRVYRLLAQRLHPDNTDTGNASLFRQLTQAYQVLSDPERRAQYDVSHARLQQQRWRLVSTGSSSENDFATEQRLRLTVLEVLYTRRRLEAQSPGMTPLDLETLIGVTREQLEFTGWYLVQKKFVTRADNSSLMITAEGVEFLEENYRENQRRRLAAAPTSVTA